MKWFRLDANALRNPKLTSVKADGILLYLRGLAYCAEHETDGLIPKHVIPSLVEDFTELELWTSRRRKPVDNSPGLVDNSTPDDARLSPTCRQVVAPVRGQSRGHLDDASDAGTPADTSGGMSRAAFDRRRQRLVRRLVEAGLWHENPNGYEVNDYLKYQPEKSELEERDERRRAADRERKRKERARKRGVPLSPDCRNVTPVTVPTIRGYSLRSNPPFDETLSEEGGTPALEGAGAPVAPADEMQGADHARAIVAKLRGGAQMP